MVGTKAASGEQHKVARRMAELKEKNRTAFIPFLVAGDPDLETTVAAIQELDTIGADVIELGVPYSDPLADGPTIQAAATRALKNGVILDKQIAENSMGFVYLVSLTGVTGMRGSTESRVEGLIQNLKETTDKSIAVGFGVSGPEQAKQIKDWGADGVIVGSALVKALGEAGSPAEGLKAMSDLAKGIREAI
eukprot:jgi/Picsp_1/5238/NSC_02601-R1_tryptophan synthase subunit alpha